MFRFAGLLRSGDICRTWRLNCGEMIGKLKVVNDPAAAKPNRLRLDIRGYGDGQGQNCAAQNCGSQYCVSEETSYFGHLRPDLYRCGEGYLEDNLRKAPFFGLIVSLFIAAPSSQPRKIRVRAMLEPESL